MPRRTSTSWLADASTFSRWSRQASASAVSTWTNDGLPWAGCGGKYVPV
jgi:hypothetical protein